MLRKCKGVPLAITSIASLLATQSMDIEIWEKIHNSLGSELDTNPTLEWMRHVLSLSYNDLSHELKTCLLYLGMYPEDYEIPKEDLVRKWMAEGFVREKRGLDIEEAAENYFNELINRSMIQPCFLEDSFGVVRACQVHDLMLDLIISKCKEENFITIIDKKYPINGASQVRRVSHQFHDRDMPLIVESMNASMVRSFITFHVADCMPPLSKFELLRVLEMKQCFSVTPMCLDLSAINHLFLLRYVRVDGYLLELPKKFGNLKHLMTLNTFQRRLYGSSELLSDSDFSSLSSLRHLSQRNVIFKNGLSKLCSLRDLSVFDIGTNSIECIRDLGELTNLRSLHVKYGYSRAVVVEKMTILATSLNKLGNNNLRHLIFQDESSGMPLPMAQFWSNCMTRPRDLQSLRMAGVLIPKLPNWIAHANRLAHAELNVQELGSDDIQVLGQLPCLTFLMLSAENNIIIQPNTFHSIKNFTFCCDGQPRLTFDPAAMPWLQRLEIRIYAHEQDAMQLQEGSSPVGGIEHLASLEEISFIIQAKCGQGSKIESACRDVISRHPKSQAMKIDVSCHEFDENGKFVRSIRNIVAGTSGED